MGKQIQFGARRRQKYVSHQKKALNKSCPKLNFVQKSPCTHMSYLPPSSWGGVEKDRHMRLRTFDPICLDNSPNTPF